MSALQITGIEVTQAIQYFGSTFPLCGPSSARSPCADNSLPLVEGKQTIFRVYISGGTPGGSVGGILVYRDDYGYERWRPALPIPTPPVPPNRAIGNHTLIFDVPEDRAKGKVTFRVHAWDLTPPVPPLNSPQTTITVSFQPRALVKVRLIRIHYVGRGMDVPPPTTADFHDLTWFLQSTFPVPSPGIQLVANTVEKYDGDFTSLFAVSPANRGTTGTIMEILERLELTEGMAANILYGAIYSSAGSHAAPDGVSKGRLFITPVSTLPGHRRSNQITLAHELAHCLGRKHAPCGIPLNTDSTYPSYGPMPPASIGEVGIDIFGREIHDPLTTKDFMSYCEPKWISAHNYQQLFARIGPPPSPPSSEKRGGLLELTPPHLTLSIMQLLDKYVIVDLPAFVVPRPVPPHNEDGAFHAELRGRDGITLIRQSFDLVSMFDALPLDSHPDIRPSPVVPIALRWVDDAARLVIFHHDETILEREIEPTPPQLEMDFEVGNKPLSGKIELRWRVESKYGEASVLVRYSPDGGDNWIGIPVPRGTHLLLLDLDTLPGGDECLIEVFASSGIRTASVRSRSFSVIRKSVTPLVLRPTHGARVRLGEPVEFFGVPLASTDDPRSLVWTSSIDGRLGTGSRLVVEGLSPGKHTIELRSDAYADRATRIKIVVEQRQ